MVYSERHESAGAFNPEHLGYITYIFGNTYDTRFHSWETYKYKEDKELLKELRICYEDVMQHKELITYRSFFQEAMGKYCNIVTSKLQETTDTKENYQEESFPMNIPTG